MARPATVVTVWATTRHPAWASDGRKVQPEAPGIGVPSHSQVTSVPERVRDRKRVPHRSGDGQDAPERVAAELRRRREEVEEVEGVEGIGFGHPVVSRCGVRRWCRESESAGGDDGGEKRAQGARGARQGALPWGGPSGPWRSRRPVSTCGFWVQPGQSCPSRTSRHRCLDQTAPARSKVSS
ncbi:hypothetical protein JCM10369A_25730 [Nocardioides pyridinolyticus]